MADKVMENSVTIVPSAEAFDALHADWRLAAEAAGATIEKHGQPEA